MKTQTLINMAYAFPCVFIGSLLDFIGFSGLYINSFRVLQYNLITSLPRGLFATLSQLHLVYEVTRKLLDIKFVNGC